MSCKLNLSIKKYYIFCYKNRKILKQKISVFSKEEDVQKKIQLSYEIMDFALRGGTGFYTIPEIEEFYVSLGERIPLIHTTKEHYPNSYLHVMTKAYPTGGHSRVVARWIECSDIKQKHSVILLNQEEVMIPDDIQRAVSSHNGEIYVSTQTDLIENAKFLREISLQYEGIILHTHPNDPTAIIAYGTNEFNTPVLMFNHADHNYWCGACIVDVLADIRDNGISQKYRNIDDVFMLRIPIASDLCLEKYITSKSVARASLGISEQTKVMLTIGRSTKYKPVGNIEFCTVMQRILQQIPDSICLGIGPTQDIGNWGRVHNCVPLGEIEYGEAYYKYLAAADLYVDSFPIYGGTAAMDAVQAKLPVLSYSVFNPDFGSLVTGVERIADENEFVKQAIYLLENNEYAQQFANKQYDTMMLYQGSVGWSAKRDELLQILKNKKHAISIKKTTIAPIDERCVFLSYGKSSSNGNRTLEESNCVMFFLKKMFFYLWDKI